MIFLYIAIFIGSCVLLYFSGRWVIEGLMKVSRFLGWREFVVAFFVMAFAASLPNLFVGVTAAFHKTPQLSFGDIAGNNLVALTVAVALAVFFAKGKEISAESRMIQTTAIFTIVAATLPLFLILDGTLSRIDGGLLVGFFVFYIFWLFSKQERFTKIYEEEKVSIKAGFKKFPKALGKVILGIALLLLAAQGIVMAAKGFADAFDISIILIGVLITGLGSALPEIYFAVVAAKRGETWMILGDLMGAVVVPATFVLGIVALICPIEIFDPSPLFIARIFLIVAALFFFFSVRTDRKITQREAFFLLGIYIAFLLVEILSG